MGRARGNGSIQASIAPRPGAARLGIGCANLPGSLSKSDALRLLETALDCGIGHFDTAPLYGWGAGEPLLGELARRRRDEMTIVTKAGIAPPSLIARAIGKLTRREANARLGRFAPHQVRASVETSLRALEVDYVDGLLLHEVQASQVGEDLAALLQELKQSGKTRALGLATSAADTAKLVAAYPGLFQIVQLAGGAPAPAGDALLIRHSLLGTRLAEAVAKGGDRSATAEKLLRAALAQNPRGVTLFSSARLEAVRRNAALATAEQASGPRAAQLLGEE